MKIYLSLFFFFASLNSYAIEYLCWQMQEMPGMAFESSAANCANGIKEKGTVSEGPRMGKGIVCVMPATCLALTPNVVKILESRFMKSITEIKKLDSKDLLLPLAGTGFVGRPSSVVCEGKGSIRYDQLGSLSLQEAKCPGFTACANTEELFYNMSMAPMTIETSQTYFYGTSPMKTTPTKQ